jgi:tetratricopeptide (TPR) repeat protein
VASVLAALAAWPTFVERAAATADPVLRQTPAPLRDDARIRRETIAFEERRRSRDPGDAITPRLLAMQYLQRYRERGDVDDVVRAEAMARRSLRLQPRGNVAALTALAGALLARHRFREARAAIRLARRSVPGDPGLAMHEASLDMEIGDVAAARGLIVAFGGGTTVASEVEASRLDELTGRLAEARRLLNRAAHRADAIYEIPAERRAWFHVRLGEMAFNAGDVGDALREEREAIARFPDDAAAWTDLAAIEAARGASRDAADAARRAVALVPSPRNLGLLADAQAATGDESAAAATRDEIDAVAKIGNAYRLVDRLLAIYDADHGVHLDEAYAIALRERELRDDVYSEDTLAWTAARAGRWDVATAAARKAIAWKTQDPQIWYHAAIVAEHDGACAAAIAGYRTALALNPQFAPAFAGDARARLARLRAGC